MITCVSYSNTHLLSKASCRNNMNQLSLQRNIFLYFSWHKTTVKFPCNSERYHWFCWECSLNLFIYIQQELLVYVNLISSIKGRKMPYQQRNPFYLFIPNFVTRKVKMKSNFICFFAIYLFLAIFHISLFIKNFTKRANSTET